MPKKPELKPAADKLPLSVRKNIRDEWEAKKPDFEKNISDLLGESWTITVDTALVYSNVADESYQSRLGSALTWYFEPLVRNVEAFVDHFGDDGKAELNSTVSKHEIKFGPQDTTNFSYCGLVVEDGMLRLVYNAPGNFASNVGDASQDIQGALKKANESGGSAYNIIARQGVKAKYEPEIEDVQEKIGALVGVKDIKLTPNFEANSEELKKDKKARDDWDRILGQVTLDYFSNFASQLERLGFANDDMLQEGFQEGVSKNEISFRVVPKLEKGSYNEIVIKDDTAYLQTTPEYFWSNVGDIGSNVLDLL